MKSQKNEENTTYILQNQLYMFCAWSCSSVNWNFQLAM